MGAAATGAECVMTISGPGRGRGVGGRLTPAGGDFTIVAGRRVAGRREAEDREACASKGPAVAGSERRNASACSRTCMSLPGSLRYRS